MSSIATSGSEPLSAADREYELWLMGGPLDRKQVRAQMEQFDQWQSQSVERTATELWVPKGAIAKFRAGIAGGLQSLSRALDRCAGWIAPRPSKSELAAMLQPPAEGCGEADEPARRFLRELSALNEDARTALGANTQAL
jgi:hypothetical protein